MRIGDIHNLRNAKGGEGVSVSVTNNEFWFEFFLRFFCYQVGVGNGEG